MNQREDRQQASAQDAFGALLSEVVGEAVREGSGAHLEVEELVEYLEDRLPAQRQERARGHLVSCRECAQQLLGLEAMMPLDDEITNEIEVARAWRDFRSRLGSEASATLPTGDVLPAPGAVPLATVSHARAPWLAAAAMLLVTLGVSFWALQLRQGAGFGPRVNPTFVYLEPATRARADDAAASFDSTGGALIAVTPSDLDLDSYQLQVVDRDGQPIWSSDLLPLTDDRLVVDMPRGFLAAGVYRMLVRGPSPADPPLDEFTFRVR